MTADKPPFSDAERAALRALFDADAARMASERPNPLDLAGPVAPSPRRSGSSTIFFGGVGLAAGVALGVGLSALVFGAQETGATTPGWRMAAAGYVALYTSETYASAPVAPGDVDAGLALASDRLGVDLSAAGAPPDGLILRRAQMLSHGGRPLVQLGYEDASGRAIALCVVERAEPGDPSPAVVADAPLAGLTAVDFRSATHAFIVLGDASPDEMEAIARALAERLG